MRTSTLRRLCWSLAIASAAAACSGHIVGDAVPGAAGNPGPTVGDPARPPGPPGGDPARPPDQPGGAGGAPGVILPMGGSAGHTPVEMPSAGPCRIAVPLRRLTSRQYRNAIRDLFGGQVQPSARFPEGELGASRSGFSTEPDANVVTLLGAEHLLDAAEEVALAAADKLPALLPCAATPSDACAGRFIDDFGARAYRRPLTAAERDLLLGVFKKAGGPEPFKDGIALVVATVLQAPQFLYLVESGTPVGGSPDVVELGDHEVAARLAFLLWDGPPDAALRDAATRGGLRTAKDIRAQVDRLLADPKAKATIARFAREWTRLKVWKAGEKATKDFTAALASGVQTEFDLFMQSAFLDSGGTVASLLTSTRTFADANLAAFYGVPPPAAPAATDFRPVMVDARTRAGLLTLPALLSSAAHEDQPSYVLRGVFVLRNLLCRDLPEPPPDAAQRLPAFPAGATQRQKSAAIQGVGACGVCHTTIDPIGLGFDGYDEIGRSRSRLPASEGGGAVDPSGVLNVGTAGLDGPFAGAVDLAGRLAGSPETSACIARQWFRFAVSRLDQDADACALGSLDRALAGSGGSLRELVIAVTTADEFRYRRLGGAP